MRSDCVNNGASACQFGVAATRQTAHHHLPTIFERYVTGVGDSQLRYATNHLPPRRSRYTHHQLPVVVSIW